MISRRVGLICYIWIKGDPRHPKTPSRPQGDRNLRGVPSQPWPQRQAGGGCRPSFVTSGGRSTNGCRTRDPWNFGVFTTRFGIWNGTLQDFPDTASIENLLKKKQLLSHPPGTGTKEQPGTEELAPKKLEVMGICRCNRIPEIDTEFQIGSRSEFGDANLDRWRDRRERSQ